MTKSIQRLIGSIAILAVSMGIAMSASAQLSNEAVGKVTTIWINDSSNPEGGGVYYQIALDNTKNMQNCEMPGRQMAGRFVTRDKAIYDLAMTAKLTGRNVHIFGGACEGVLQKLGFLYID